MATLFPCDNLPAKCSKAGAYKLWLRKPCKVRALFLLGLFDGRCVGMCRSVMGKCVFHKLKVHNIEGRFIVCKWKFGIVEGVYSVNGRYTPVSIRKVLVCRQRAS